MNAPTPDGVTQQYEPIRLDLPTWTQDPTPPSERTFVAEVRALMSQWGGE